MRLATAAHDGYVRVYRVKDGTVDSAAGAEALVCSDVQYVSRVPRPLTASDRLDDPA